jgi:RNA polymerase sigma factor for flagellar operon FliA
MRAFALEGLVAAMEDYDPRKGASFNFYSQKKIRWAIYDGLREMGWFPRGLRRKMKFYRQAHEMLEMSTGTPPPQDKIDAVHRLSDKLKELATAYITSYTAETENEPASVPPEAETHLIKKESSNAIKKVIERLPPKEKNVVLAYYFEDKKLSEIAQELRLSNSWVSKILASGLKRIRRSLNENPELLKTLLERE